MTAFQHMLLEYTSGMDKEGTSNLHGIAAQVTITRDQERVTKWAEEMHNQ